MINSRRPSRRAFTLTELMVSVLVLVAIILATAKIFSTASQVTGAGQANADVLQEVAAFERQFRQDIARINPNGFLAIRCVALENDIRGGAAPLINPNLDADATIRADQLVFFTNGVSTMQSFARTDGGGESQGANRKVQATAARVYYGPAYQLPDSLPRSDVNGDDPVPWFTDPQPTTDGVQNFAVLPATSWVAARQAILLGDDGGDSRDFLSYTNVATDTIRDAAVRDGRVDVAAGELDDIRDFVTAQGTLGWAAQRDRIRATLFYPRAERAAPSMARYDFMTTTATLASACSSFIVEWTYGEPFSSNDQRVWFGYRDLDRGVMRFTQDYFEGYLGQNYDPDNPLFPVYEDNRPDLGDDYENGNLGAWGAFVYESFFGFNNSTAYDETGTPQESLVYTPWPTAIRITMVLHDTKERLANGRTVQFVVDLPQRSNSNL